MQSSSGRRPRSRVVVVVCLILASASVSLFVSAFAVQRAAQARALAAQQIAKAARVQAIAQAQAARNALEQALGADTKPDSSPATSVRPAISLPPTSRPVSTRPAAKHETSDARRFNWWRPRPTRHYDHGIVVERDLEYARADERSLRLDLYLPETRDGRPRPLVVWIHGGAWLVGSKDHNRTARWVRDGYITASVEYRRMSAARYPAQLHDCKAAVRWLRGHADEYGIDPNRIGVWGSSAGGHLAALLGTTGDVAELEGDLGEHLDESSRVQAVVDWFGPTDFLRLEQQAGPDHAYDFDAPGSIPSLLIGGPVQEHPDRCRQANPATFATADDPPFLIMHGDADALVPLGQSRLLYDALRAAGVDNEFVTVLGGDHGFRGRQRELMPRVRAFFDKHLKGETTSKSKGR